MPAGGEQHARAFYVDVLGFAEIAKPPLLVARGGLWLRSGSIDLHLGVDADFRPARKAHPALRCVNYSALLKRLGEHAVPIVPDVHPIGDSRHCYVADPFGNRLELIEDDPK